MNYTKKWSTMYLLIFKTMFVVGAIIYALLSIGLIFQESMGIIESIIILLLGIVIGGYFLSSILCSILIATNYLSQQTLRFQQIAAILFILTYFIVLICGFIFSIPIAFKSYQFLNNPNFK